MAASGETDAATERRQQAFATMLHALRQPEAFPAEALTGVLGAEAGGETRVFDVELVQTHASAVLLAGERAYKLKKPNDFGFFDYSTPELRRHFCAEEVRLNTRLAPHVYLGVAAVVALGDGSYHFAATCPPDATPAPGDTLDGGAVVDYAVVMVRLPDEATLEARVRAGTARPELLVAVAERMAAFHAASPHTDAIARFGGVDVIEHNWNENFEQMAPYIGRALDAATYIRIEAYVRSFLSRRRELFEVRQQAGSIRDCHGDVRMQHIYVLDQPAADDNASLPVGSLAIVDCIEFNERFRYGDVAGEVAFLTMELDLAGRPDLARAFTDAYVALTGDEALRELLPFYACYRACVRGKVLAFQLDDPAVPEDQREEARCQAQTLFTLAGRYASGPTSPVLLLIGGLMGTGKSTLARRLARERGWGHIASDVVRKESAGLDPLLPQEERYGQGIYSRERSAATYAAMRERAATLLATGRSVLLDASFARQADRQDAVELARTLGAEAWFVECVCPRALAVQRLDTRWGDKQRHAGGAADASDGRPELYDAQAASWAPFDARHEPDVAYVRVETSASAAANVASILDALGIMSPACWL